MSKLLLTTAVITVALSGCDLYNQNTFESEYVVEAYLIAGEPLPEIRLSTTAPINSHYRFEDYGVTDAEIEVHRLASDGSHAESYRYRPNGSGIFVPLDPGVVEPGNSYALVVRIPSDGAVLKSVSHVPGAFAIRSVSADTLAYQGAEQLEAWVSRSAYPGRQSIYAFTTTALDTTGYDLTPMYAGLVETAGDVTGAELVQNYAGVSNQTSISREVDSEGNLLLRLPWASIAYFGPNEITVAAVDDNMYDFLRSLDGMSMVPGQMENLIDHVEGGRGIFGSLAEARATVYVQPPPAQQPAQP